MPTPAYISITGKTQGNITQGAFTADSVGNVYVADPGPSRLLPAHPGSPRLTPAHGSNQP